MLTRSLPAAGWTPDVIGADLFFLIDSEDGFRATDIISIVEMIEADAFYDEPGRMNNAHMFLLSRGSDPISVRAEYTIYSRDSEWVYKIMRVYSPTGDMLAQHGYRIPVVY